MMIRTYGRLSKREYEAAKKETKQQGISLAEFFGRALVRALPLPKYRPSMRFCGLVESGNPHSSETWTASTMPGTSAMCIQPRSCGRRRVFEFS